MNKTNPITSMIRYLVLIAILASLAGCKGTKLALPKVRGYQASEEEKFMADSQKGFQKLPGTAVYLRTIINSDSVRVEIRTHDTITLRSLLINGVSIWIDPKGEKNMNYGVAFQAARSEMLRQSGEFMPPPLNPGDTTPPPPPPPFNPGRWIEAIGNLDAVITDKDGTRFDDQKTAKVFMNENNELVYSIRLAYNQMDSLKSETGSFSVGVVSERHQAIQTSSQGGGGIATRPDISDRPRQQQPHPGQMQRSMRMPLIPVVGWIKVVFKDEELPKPEMTEGDQIEGEADDIYR